jgi:outer membrane biosynthesis protein TonB
MLKRTLAILLALTFVVWPLGVNGNFASAQGGDPELPPAEETVAPEPPLTVDLTEELPITSTEELTPELTITPTEVLTEVVTEEPTEVVTEEPTEVVTEEPTEAVTEEPTEVVTEEPTEAVTEEPTEAVTEEPTEESTEAPPDARTEEPTVGSTEIEGAAVVNPPNQTSHVLLQNLSSSAADVTVTVYDTSGASIFNSSFQLAAKGARTLHASAGTNSSGHLYMDLSAPQSSMVVESTERLVATNVSFGSPTAHNIYEGFESGETSTDILVPSIHWRDAQWSLIGIQNAGTSAANVEIRYYRQDGTQIGSKITVNNLGIGASIFRNARNDVSISSVPAGVGSMRVTSTNGQALAVAVIETLFTYTYSYIGIPVSGADTDWSFPSVHRNPGGQFSHILVQNTSTTTAAKVRLTYYDQSGNQVDQFTNISIPAKGALTFHTTNELSGDSQSYTPIHLGNVGAATIKSNNGVNLVATVVEAVGSAPYAYNGFNSSSGATTVLLPSVHRNLGGQFSHTLVQNTSTTQSNRVRIRYYKQDGSVANTFQTTLAESGSITFHTTNELSTDGGNYTPTSLGNVGSAEVTSLDSRPILAVVVETVFGLPGAYAGFK